MSGRKCLACGKEISGPPKIMKLQITAADPKLLERAKQLGFTSSSWKEGDSLEGAFDESCFQTVIFVWQAAFHTRLVSPRR